MWVILVKPGQVYAAVDIYILFTSIYLEFPRSHNSLSKSSYNYVRSTVFIVLKK